MSKGVDFYGMFFKCSSLSDIKSLENWDVSNGTRFSYMFYQSSSLSNIKHWKIGMYQKVGIFMISSRNVHHL